MRTYVQANRCWPLFGRGLNTEGTMTTPTSMAAGLYQNFSVAVYARVYEIQKMSDTSWRETSWGIVADQLKVDKLYIETHRDRVVAEGTLLTELKAFFAERGIRTAGGIASVANETNRFESFCYTDRADREFVKHLAEHTARYFDEIILDDFFFVNSKTESDIAARGNNSWTDFRVDLMRDAAVNLILEPARSINPNVKIVIKYPNWYEHFRGLGFDLGSGPALFDGIYAGTETRSPEYNAQHLQQYLSYSILRYFENIAPGRNGGGWVDTGGLTYLDRYSEQIFLTLIAGAKEITLFDLRQLLSPVAPDLRGEWQGFGTSFDFDVAVASDRSKGGPERKQTFARAAAIALEQADSLLDDLGNATGLVSYRPCDGVGEEFLHNFIGMSGIPIDLTPYIPDTPKTILLTEAAAVDDGIVAKIERLLRLGTTVIITSGLLNVLQDRGIRNIVEWRCNGRRFSTSEFYFNRSIYRSERDVTFPQVEYLTNDSWELVGGGANGYPILLEAAYSTGKLLTWVIPDNPSDLYLLPAEVLNRIRGSVMKDMLYLEGPSRVSLFTYDNGTFITQSFNKESVVTSVVAESSIATIRDLLTGEQLVAAHREIKASWHREAAEFSVFEITLMAHSYRAFSTRGQL